jgi:hypothetical protein
MWQEIAIIIIGIITAIYLAWKIFKFFSATGKSSPCVNCKDCPVKKSKKQ